MNNPFGRRTQQTPPPAGGYSAAQLLAMARDAASRPGTPPAIVQSLYSQYMARLSQESPGAVPESLFGQAYAQMPGWRSVRFEAVLFDGPNGRPNGRAVGAGTDVFVTGAQDGWCQIAMPRYPNSPNLNGTPNLLGADYGWTPCTNLGPGRSAYG